MIPNQLCDPRSRTPMLFTPFAPLPRRGYTLQIYTLIVKLAIFTDIFCPFVDIFRAGVFGGKTLRNKKPFDAQVEWFFLSLAVGVVYSSSRPNNSSQLCVTGGAISLPGLGAKPSRLPSMTWRIRCFSASASSGSK